MTKHATEPQLPRRSVEGLRRLVFIVFVVTGIVPFEGAVAEPYEAPPERRVEAVLAPRLRQGKLFRVLDPVLNNGFLNVYYVDSPFGLFEVTGTHALVTLISELDALQIIADHYPTEDVALDTAKEQVEGIVQAPIDATKRLIATAMNPSGVWEMLSSVPRGIMNLYRAGAKLTNELWAGARSQRQKTSPHSESVSESIISPQHIRAATEYVSRKILDLVGYEDAYRNTAQELRVDPYTDNPVLRRELMRIASIHSAGVLGKRFLPGISVPYVGDVNRYTGYLSTVASYENPARLEELTRQILKALGRQKDGQAKSAYPRAVDQFLSNPSYSPPMRQAFVDSVWQLHTAGVHGAEEFLITAAQAASREGAAFFVEAASALLNLQKSNIPLKGVMPNQIVLAAIDAGQNVVVPLPVDYLVWTRGNATIMRGIAVDAAQRPGMAGVRLLLEGDASDRCRRELKELGFVVETRRGVDGKRSARDIPS